MTRILFITATRIGDAVLSTGILDHLIRTQDNPHVTVACGPLAAPLFRALPELDDIIVMVKQKGGGHWIKLWANAVTQRWDIVVDLRGSATSWFLLAGARYVKRGVVSKDEEPVHKVIENARVLGLDTPPNPVLWLSQAAQDTASSRLMPGGPVLGLAPSAAAPFKEWPRARFGQLALALTRSGPLKNARIAVFGGPGDETASREAVEELDPDRVVDLTGQLTIDEAAAAMQQLDLFVGNDSGLMHLAAAAGTPTLGLFGPTDERVYGPWGQRTSTVRAGGEADESQRGKLRFASETLMGDLEVETVRAAAETLIKETSSS